MKIIKQISVFDNCFNLLNGNAQAGGQSETHCDGMIKKAIELIEESR